MTTTAMDAIFRVEPDDPAPAYIQLERQIRVAVAAGTLQPGDHLPPVRQAARRLGLSPNTVGRAYADLSREGVITARAGGGSEIASRDRLDHAALFRTRQERLRTLARQVVVRGLALGLEPGELVGAVERELAQQGRPVPDSTPRDQLGDDEQPLLSARNRLRGNVTGLRVGEVLAEVTLTLGDGTEVVAAVTRSSVDRLGLSIGSNVSAYVKATELVLGR